MPPVSEHEEHAIPTTFMPEGRLEYPKPRSYPAPSVLVRTNKEENSAQDATVKMRNLRVFPSSTVHENEVESENPP